jgi:hypothetical protein
MLFTTDQVTALATARNNGQRLSDALVGEAPPTTLPTELPTVATTVEALAAVIPTGVVGLYTLIVLPISQYADKAATAASADKAANLARNPDNSQADIETALAKLTQESGDWLALRWGVLALTAVVVVALITQAARAGNKPGRARKAPVAEALAAAIAFLAWALATPGTPLATHFTAADMTIVSGSIVGVAALLLLALGKGVLTKPAGRAK